MKRLKLLSIILCCISTTYAQKIGVTASIDSTVILIGEQTKLSIEVVQPSAAQVQFPIFSDTIVSGLEIVERLPADTQPQTDGLLRISQNYLLTAFDSALFYIEPLPVVCDNDTFYSNALSLKVLTIPVDTTQQVLADIKGIYAPPFDWPLFWRIVGYVLATLIVAAIIWLIYNKLKKNKQTNDEAPEELADPRPAHVIAFERLEIIKSEKIWQQNRSKEYHTQLTEVLRDYIGRRFEINATELTTAEILTKLKKELKKQKEPQEALRQLLTLSDLVKFAKYQPLIDEDEKALTQAFGFVEATKEEETFEVETKTIETNHDISKS